MARAERWVPLAVPLPRWALALAGLLALAFGATGLGKALDLAGFARILGDFELFPRALLLPLALGVTVLELIIAAGLLAEATRARAARAAILVAAGHAAVLSLTLARGITLENCGCFGVFWARPLTLASPLEDVALLLFAWLVWRAARA
jgi:hypothetical protein